TPASAQHPLRVIGQDALVAGPLAPALMPQFATDLPGVDRLTLFAPDAIALNAAAQRSLGVRPGDRITVQAGLRAVPLRVVGSVTAGGDPLGVMDLAGAQDTFGLLGRLSRLDVQLQGGADANTVVRSLALPPGVLGEAAEAAGQRVANVSRAYRVNLTVLALVALFTGAFLVFSILSLSVAKRTQQFALLGVLGLTARERLRLVLWESAAIGLIGSVLGLALGTGLAAAALRLLAGDLGGGYFPGITPSLRWSPWAAAGYGVLGVLAAIVGGLLPARAAQRLAPAQALKGLGDAVRPPRHPWVGPALLALGALLTRLPPVGGVPLGAYVAVACLLVGGIACVPVAVGALLRLWPRATVNRHAALMLSLERVRRMRHTATVAMAGVVASLSLSVALTVMVASFRESVTHWLDIVLPADLYARTARQTSGAESLRLERDFLNTLRQLPGVARISGLRISALALRPDQPAVALLARPLRDAEGQDQAARSLPLVSEALPARPGLIGVFVSEAMVDLYDARPGTVLALPLQAGQPPVPAWVRGVWRDYARQSGAIVMDEADYLRLTGDTAINDLALWLTPGTRTADVQAAIRAAATARGLDGAVLEFAEPREIRQ
ncbi:MAG TPA: ABC transporter permease, partial [Aquabacterium sp.]|nr:ABC transporter permease [Aquabacterium sp.]